MQESIIKILRFAHRARKLTFGMSATLQQLHKKKVGLLILTEDLSDNSRKKISLMAESQRLPILSLFTKNECGEIFGREEIGIIGVTDETFVRSLLKMSDRS